MSRTGPVHVQIPPGVGGLAEDKDEAKALRIEKVLPALTASRTVVLDFSTVDRATQSYVHALIGEALGRWGEDVLDSIEFRSCSDQLREVVTLVVDYSLGGFELPAT